MAKKKTNDVVEESPPMEPMTVQAAPITASIKPRYATDEMMLRTIQGKAYVVTVESGNVEVKGCNSPDYAPGTSLQLLNIDKPGQYSFIAISSYTYIIPTDAVYAITPVDFKVASFGVSSGGGGESFDPTQNYNVSGNWLFQNTLRLDDNQKLQLGNGVNALTISGDGAGGAAVMEGNTATNLDVTISMSFQNPVIFHDSVTFGSLGITVPGDINANVIRSTNGNVTITNKSGIVTFVVTNYNNTGAIFHKSNDPTPCPPSSTSVNRLAIYSVGQLDERYAKLETSLTQAQYDALATKDSRTLYLTTDTAKVYIGSNAVNP